MKIIKTIILCLLITGVSGIFAQTDSLSGSDAGTKTDSTQTITLKVKGLNCAMDVQTISDQVEKLKGVSSCSSLKMGTTSKFEIKYHPAWVSRKEIETAIENTPGCENINDRPYKVKK